MVTMLSVLAHASPEPVVPEIDQHYAAVVNRNWRGLGIGYDNGLWGSSYGQGLKLDVPFGPRLGQFVGVRLRGVMTVSGGGAEPIGMAGVELFGRTPVYAGLVRLYGGGGLWYGGAFDQPELQVAGGGHYGVEVALNPRMSFHFEVGGQSPVDAAGGRDAGASVMGGATIYLGGLGQGR